MAARNSNTSLSGSEGNPPEDCLSPGSTPGPQAANSEPRSKAKSIGICLLLLAAVVWTFLPSLHNGFVNFDDDSYLYDNVHVQSGLSWQGIRWAFTNLQEGFWHPLTWLSILADYQLYGLDPRGYHLTSLILHAATTVLLFLALWRMTGATWRSAFVAALFGLHPLHVESVAWVSERKDVLSGTFWALTLWAYAHYAEWRRQKAEGRTENTERGAEKSKIQNPKSEGSPKSEIRIRRRNPGNYYAIALGFFVCGLMSKPMLVTLPLVLLLLDYWPLGRFKPHTQHSTFKTLLLLVREKVPFLAVAFVFGVVTICAVRGVGALGPATRYPLLGRVQNALYSYWWYIGKTVWPTDLAVFYPYPKAFSVWVSAGAGLLGLVVSALLLWGARKRPCLAAGWIWYVVTLLPMAGLIQVGDFSRADRFAYVPLIGVFLLLTWGAYEWARRWRHGVVGLAAAGAVTLFMCAFCSRQQVGYWRDSDILWLHALDVTKHNDVAHHNLGVALLSRGAFDEAIRHFEAEVRINPARKTAHHSLACALLGKHQFAEAIHHFEEALRANPEDGTIHNDLANALREVGRVEEAIQHYTEALRRDLNVPQVHYNLGLALASRGHYREAVAEFREVIRLNPNDANACQHLNRALAGQDKLEQAAEPYRRVLRTNPDDARAHGDLGRVLLEAGQLDEAMEQCAEAARLAPQSPEAQYQLGVALSRKGEGAKAARQFELVLKLDPKFAAAHYALGILRQQQQQMPEALKHWREAARLAPQWPDPLNNLAWALATDPKAQFRDGAEAVTLATRALALAGTNNVGVLDTLAAAYAEAGRFAEAASTAQQAHAAAVAQGQAELADLIQRRLASYSSNQPYRQEPNSR